MTPLFKIKSMQGAKSEVLRAGLRLLEHEEEKLIALRKALKDVKKAV